MNINKIHAGINESTALENKRERTERGLTHQEREVTLVDSSVREFFLNIGMPMISSKHNIPRVIQVSYYPLGICCLFDDEKKAADIEKEIESGQEWWVKVREIHTLKYMKGAALGAPTLVKIEATVNKAMPSHIKASPRALEAEIQKTYANATFHLTKRNSDDHLKECSLVDHMITFGKIIFEDFFQYFTGKGK